MSQFHDSVCVAKLTEQVLASKKNDFLEEIPHEKC